MSADKVVEAALDWLGTPYRHQAATLGAGCDCLGLVRGVWRTLYGSEPAALPTYSADWRDPRHADELLEMAERWLTPAEGLEAGRVVLFRLGPAPLPRHCAILVSGTRFIHAQERLGVVEANLTEGWKVRVARVFGFPGQG